MIEWYIWPLIALVAVLLAVLVLYLIHRSPLDVISTGVECTIDAITD